MTRRAWAGRRAAAQGAGHARPSRSAQVLASNLVSVGSRSQPDTSKVVLCQAFLSCVLLPVAQASFLHTPHLILGCAHASIHPSCAGAGVPLMAAGGGAGVVTVWNLEARRLHAVLRDAHDAPLTALHFFAGEPRLMSAGRDNALKQWVLDDAGESGAARLLRFRSGHAAPPTVLRYYGESGTRLLSAGGAFWLTGCPRVTPAAPAALMFRMFRCWSLCYAVLLQVDVTRTVC